MQLIVLGMHRSGTSMVARLLNLMGVYFGPEGLSTGANPENPKGFWERKDIRALNDYVLQGAGCDWNRALRFDPLLVPPAIREDFDRRASRLLLEMDAHRPWLMKEPRLCLTLPLWRERLEAPVGIHVLRHPVEVASSLRQRNGIPIEAGLELWERYVRSAHAAAAGLPAVTVFHRQLVEDPKAAVAALHGSLSALGVQGLRQPSARELDAFIDRRLYRERLDRPDLRAATGVPQEALFGALVAGRALEELPAEAPMRALAEYEASLPPLEASGRIPETGDEERRRLAAQLKAKQEELQAKERELAAVRKVLEGERDRLTARLEAKEDALALAQQKAMAAASQLQHAKQAKAFAEQAAAARLADSAKLTRMLVQRDRDLEDARGQLAALAAARDAADAEMRMQHAETERLLRASTAEAGELRRQLALVTGSFTWRLGGPLRRIRRMFGRQGPTQPASDADLLRTSEWFDADWYLRRYPDVAENGSDAAEHYLAFGAAEGRNPGPMFSTTRYLENNPDVGESGMNPLVHFLKHGQFEGRKQ